MQVQRKTLPDLSVVNLRLPFSVLSHHLQVQNKIRQNQLRCLNWGLSLKKSDGKSQMKNARVDVTYLFLTVDLKGFALAQGETGAFPIHNRPSSVPEKYWDQLRL